MVGPPSLSSLARMPDYADYGDRALNSSESFVHGHRNCAQATFRFGLRTRARCRGCQAGSAGMSDHARNAADYGEIMVTVHLTAVESFVYTVMYEEMTVCGR
jgi:hypothetical protein